MKNWSQPIKNTKPHAFDYKISFGDTHFKVDEEKAKKQEDSYLNADLSHILPTTSDMQPNHFNQKLQKYTKQRYVAGVQDRRSKCRKSKFNGETDTLNQKGNKKLLIIDDEPSKEKGQSLDLRRQQRSQKSKKSSKLKSLSSQKKTTIKIPLLSSMHTQKRESQQSIDQKAKEEETEKRNNLIKSILRRCHINRQNISYGEDLVRSCEKEESRETRIAIIKLDAESSTQKMKKMEYPIHPDNNHLYRKYLDRSKKKKPRCFFRGKTEGSGEEQDKPSTAFKCMGDRLLNLKCSDHLRKLPFSEEIGPWLEQDNDF